MNETRIVRFLFVQIIIFKFSNSFFFFNSFADLCFIDLFKKKKKEKKKTKNRRLLFIGNGKTGQTEKKKN